MAKKILIVDDERDIVEVVRMRLETRGYEVFAAYNGRQGLERVKDVMPDLVILDIMMPEINGSTLCGMLKFDERYKHIPIVMLSVKARDIDREIGGKVKADAYLTKPFEAQQLIEIVNNLIGE
ncbi:MAG TPA: response regulator [Candidatus Omnitrophota bacterium]|nr:response regulator [Candidatus Omnitrophota bacterium]